MAVATFTKSSALLGQKVVSHHCRALRISASRLKSYSSRINLASSIVGFFGIVFSLNFPLGDSTPEGAALFPTLQTVRQRDTFIPPADAHRPAEPLPLATSLFDSVASALLSYGTRIALTSSGSCVPRIEKTPLRE